MNKLLILMNSVFSTTQYVPRQNTKYVYIFKILAAENSSDNYWENSSDNYWPWFAAAADDDNNSVHFQIEFKV